MALSRKLRLGSTLKLNLTPSSASGQRNAKSGVAVAKYKQVLARVARQLEQATHVAWHRNPKSTGGLGLGFCFPRFRVRVFGVGVGFFLKWWAPRACRRVSELRLAS